MLQHFSDPGVASRSFGQIALTESALRPVSLDDRDLFAAALGRLAEPTSDCSFAATVCWSEPLELRVAVIDEHLCLFSLADDELTMMLPPLCVGDPFGLGSATEACFEIMDEFNTASLRGGAVSRIEYVPTELRQPLASACGLGWTWTEMPGDYVYPTQAMVELAGGPLKAKRKLRSRFLREHPDVRCSDLRDDDVEECLALLDSWTQHGDERHEGVANEQLVGLDVLRSRDAACTRRYLELREALGMQAMVVRSGGQLVAFTLGEFLTPDMFSICVEKTRPGVAGAAQFVFSEFCRTRAAGACEINAGDDWGVASLRFTKTSYRPSRMLAKFGMTRAASSLVGSGEDAVRLLSRRPAPAFDARPRPVLATGIRPAKPDDLAAILAVERESFAHERDRFSARQVRRLIANPRARVAVAEANGGVVAWCAGLIRTHVRSRSGRVYSIAVCPAASGRGTGRALLDWMLRSFEEAGVQRAYLEVRASNAAAIALYRSAGFEDVRPLPSYYAGEDGLRMRRSVSAGTTQPNAER